MTVRTHNIALRSLREKLLATLECGTARTQLEHLFGWVSMIEVHLVARETAAAVRARHFTKLSKELGRGDLPASDPVYFLLPIRPVVGDIEGSLIPGFWHTQ